MSKRFYILIHSVLAWFVRWYLVTISWQYSQEKMYACDFVRPPFTVILCCKLIRFRSVVTELKTDSSQVTFMYTNGTRIASIFGGLPANRQLTRSLQADTGGLSTTFLFLTRSGFSFLHSVSLCSDCEPSGKIQYRINRLTITNPGLSFARILCNDGKTCDDTIWKQINDLFSELFADDQVESPSSIAYLLSEDSFKDYGMSKGSAGYRYGNNFYGVGEWW